MQFDFGLRKLISVATTHLQPYLPAGFRVRVQNRFSIKMVNPDNKQTRDEAHGKIFKET
jgi:hypothetical protein